MLLRKINLLVLFSAFFCLTGYGQNVQKTCIEKLTSNLDVQKIKNLISDSVKVCLDGEIYPPRIKHTDVSKLEYFVIYNARLDSQKIYSYDQDICDFIIIRDDIPPYCAAIYKSKRFWGIIFLHPLPGLEQISDFDRDEIRRLRNFYSTLKNLKGDIYFMVNGFNFNIIWYVKGSQVYVYRYTYPDNYEANEFIRKNYPEDVINKISRLK